MREEKDLNAIPAFLKDFLVYMEVIQGKSKKTVNEYFLDMRTFFRYLKCLNKKADFDNFNKIPISDITIEDLQSITLSTLYEYMYYITTVRKNSHNARARKVSSLKTFFKYMTNNKKLLNDNPAKDLESPKIPDLLPKYLTLDESIKLLSSVKGEFEVRNYAIITLFLNCGLRLSELVSINISDYKENKLTVIGKGNKQRTVYLNNSCILALDNYLRVRPHDGVIDKDAMFLSSRKTRISRRMVENIVKDAVKEAGLDSKKYSAHKLRHTAATLMYKHGNVDIRALQEVLGHKHLSTTQIYTHIDDERLRDAANSNPLANIKPNKK